MNASTSFVTNFFEIPVIFISEEHPARRTESMHPYTYRELKPVNYDIITHELHLYQIW